MSHVGSAVAEESITGGVSRMSESPNTSTARRETSVLVTAGFPRASFGAPAGMTVGRIGSMDPGLCAAWPEACAREVAGCRRHPTNRSEPRTVDEGLNSGLR
jgi:hypothetical protein